MKPLIHQGKDTHEEKLAFVQSNSEKAEDALSMTTETSDSGMLGTHGTPSEHAMEEARGTLILLYSFRKSLAFYGFCSRGCCDFFFYYYASSKTHVESICNSFNLLLWVLFFYDNHLPNSVNFYPNRHASANKDAQSGDHMVNRDCMFNR